MKPQYPKSTALIISVLTAQVALAQPALEMTTGSATPTTGATIASQVVTLQNNTNNPSGNSFSAFTPTTTVTYTLTNQQYALRRTQSNSPATVAFGATNNNGGSSLVGVSTFNTMNFISAAPNNVFSSIPPTIGQGMDVTVNDAVELFTSAMGLYNSSLSTSGRYLMATLTLTFNVPVSDPVLQLVGIGGFYSNLGFTSELEMQPIAGVSLVKLSGSSELNVTGNKILNSAANPSSVTGSGAASGSILVNGTNITQLVFQIYMRGDGGETSWAASGEHTGDAWLLGVSMETSMFVLPLQINNFTATAEGNSSLLEWNATTQDNTDHFSVEYSQDGTNWQSLGNVKAAGSTGSTTSYSYVQYNPAFGNAFYRIAEVNTDGSFTYSSVQRLSFGQASSLTKLYPNPTHGVVTITSSVVKTVELLSIDGKVLQVANGFHSGESIDLSSYPAGVYVLVVRNTDGTSQVEKIQKN